MTALQQALAPSQLFGYAALVLGISAFLQRSDLRLRLFNACQSLFYTVHFVLLGNFAAAVSAIVSSVRSFVSLRWRSPILAVVFIVLSVGLGAMVVHGALGWLPIIASCLSTGAIFLLAGIPMRLILLVSTFLWLANNIVSGSIGGTVLEFLIAAANLATIIRLFRARKVLPS